MVKMNELDGKAGSLSPTLSQHTLRSIPSRALSSYLRLTAPVQVSSTSWCLQVSHPSPPNRRRSAPFLHRGSAPSVRARTAWPTVTRSQRNWCLHHPPQPEPIHLPTSDSEKLSPTTAPLPSLSKSFIPTAAAILLSVMCQSIKAQVESWKLLIGSCWFFCLDVLFFHKLIKSRLCFVCRSRTLLNQSINGLCVKADLLWTLQSIHFLR